MRKTSILIYVAVCSIAIVFLVMAVSIPGSRNRQLAEFIGSRIDFAGLPHPEALCTMIVMYDSTDCATCRLSRATEWDLLFQECAGISGFRQVMIFSPKDADMERFRTMASKENLSGKTIICDAKSSFSSVNSKIPKDRSLHCFLIDGNNNVILAGDPLHNGRLWGLYKLYIEAVCSNDGRIPDGFGDSISGYMEASGESVNGLVFESRLIHVGVIECGRPYALQFQAQNLSDHTVIISNVIPDCDCTEASVCPEETGPSEKTTVSASFRIAEPGEFCKRIFVRTAGDREDIELVFTGTAENKVCK